MRMETVTLTITKTPTLFLEAEAISPDGLAGKTLDQIRVLPVYMGREQFTLAMAAAAGISTSSVVSAPPKSGLQ